MKKDLYRPQSKKKKQPRVAILISDKVDSRTKTLTKDKEGQNVMIKGSIHQENVGTYPVGITNNRTPDWHLQNISLKTNKNYFQVHMDILPRWII